MIVFFSLGYERKFRGGKQVPILVLLYSLMNHWLNYCITLLFSSELSTVTLISYAHNERIFSSHRYCFVHGAGESFLRVQTPEKKEIIHQGKILILPHSMLTKMNEVVFIKNLDKKMLFSSLS
ncbi:unnamed protein product [Allacma fusca]|uniref:Uncharacterized protein n=1 Tax=Allacma fusca TaxID=39272 RepID=A0A8J2KII5_9HEXA|nr:unnamed protein product [Allacma fusca]